MSGLLQPGGSAEIPAGSRFLSLDIRWGAGTQTAFADRIDVAAFPLVRGRLTSREHLVFSNQPLSPDGSLRLGHQRGVVEIDLPSVPDEVERISVVAYVRPRPNAPRRTLDELDSLSVSVQDALERRDIARTASLAVTFSSVTAATIMDVLRNSGRWTLVVQNRGHESGLEGAAAAVGVRL